MSTPVSLIGYHLTFDAEHPGTREVMRDAPLLLDSLASFECERYANYDGGDHVIIVGHIRRFAHLVDPDRKGPGPLLYYRGRFGNLTAMSG